MQLLSDNSFAHYHLINFTNKLFFDVFDKDVKLLMHDTNDGGMGYFILKYLFIPQNYTIVFEHDRFFFSIRIYNANGAFSSINHLPDTKIDNALNEQNILIAVNVLNNALKGTPIPFYRLKKNRIVREEI